MIEHPTWRSLFYKLAENYPDCLMLNFTVKVISINLICWHFLMTVQLERRWCTQYEDYTCVVFHSLLRIVDIRRWLPRWDNKCIHSLPPDRGLLTSSQNKYNKLSGRRRRCCREESPRVHSQFMLSWLMYIGCKRQHANYALQGQINDDKYIFYRKWFVMESIHTCTVSCLCMYWHKRKEAQI